RSISRYSRSTISAASIANVAPVPVSSAKGVQLLQSNDPTENDDNKEEDHARHRQAGNSEDSRRVSRSLSRNRLYRTQQLACGEVHLPGHSSARSRRSQKI